MTIRAFYAAIPPETFQELSVNLLFSTTFSMINCPTHKSAQINGVKVALLVVLAKAIEASILASWKLADDYFHRLYGKPPEPLKWEIKLITSAASWCLIICLPWPESWVHPRTMLIAFITSLPVILLRKD
jgi:hypothetical protein